EIFDDGDALGNDRVAIEEDWHAAARRLPADGLLPAIAAQEHHLFVEGNAEMLQSEPGPQRPARIVAIGKKQLHETLERNSTPDGTRREDAGVANRPCGRQSGAGRHWNAQGTWRQKGSRGAAQPPSRGTGLPEVELGTDAYDKHPKHVAFVRDRWSREVDAFLEIDYEPL